MMNGMKNDKLDALILLSAHVLAEKNAEEFRSADTSDVKVPKYMERRIRRMINREHRKAEYGKWYTALRNTAAGILIVCTVAFAAMMSVEAVREALWSAVIEFYEEYISITHLAYNDPPAIIEEKKEPTAIPDEWESEVISDSKSLYYIRYLYNEVKTLDFKQQVIDDSEEWIDNENSIVENIIVGGNEGNLVLLLDKGMSFLVWNDGCYSYTINFDTSIISRDMAMNIAESVK